MSTMTLMGEHISDDVYEVTATPDFGNRIRLRVAKGAYSAGYSNRTGYIVMTATGGTISAHRTFERAVSEAITRAKRYVAAYSKPRGRAAR